MIAPAVPRRPTAGRPGVGALLRDQLVHSLLELWRTRVVLIFSLALPLVWVLVVGAVAGNATVDPTSGLRVMQFATPVAMSMGVLYGTYPTMAIGLAEAREHGVLKRLRGTPLPAWIHLAGRIGAAVVLAFSSAAASVLLAVAVFGVRIVWSTVPATVVTLVVGTACFAALGLAVASLAPSQAFAQAASIGTAVALTFVSGLFSFGQAFPAWLERLGDVLPLKPVNLALQDQFNPYHPGAGWTVGRALVVVGWGLAAAVVAARFFRWETRTRPTRSPVRQAVAHPGAPPRGAGPARRPSAVTMVLDQTRAANRSAWRDAGSLFFALVMPVGLYALLTAIYGSGSQVGPVPFAVFYAASMVAWGASVAVFLNLPEAVAAARDRGVLKRLRGTPLAPWQYLAGRTAAGLWVSFVVCATVLAVGVAFYDVRLSPAAVAAGLFVLLVGALTMTACGFVLAAAVSTAREVAAVGLLILLPLGFFSDIFMGSAPAWMHTVGSFFPLLHLQNALEQAWDPAGASLAWGDVAVLLLWGVGAAALAVRLFRWEPRRG